MESERPLDHSASTPLSAARRDLADGRYVLVRHVAEGGTAHVYLGYDTWTETWRAVKTLLPEYARRPALRHRFAREAATMKTLSHDNIIAVYDAGIEQETVFMVMEYAEGGSVIDWVERNGPMPPRMATNVVLELCRGIDAAHRQGVIHRDIKPQNLLVDRNGLCKVTDFGIAQVLEDTRMTMTGTVMGTMGYMAPEQNESAKHADERADVYSIAATYYTLLKGEAATHLFMAEEHDFDGIPEGLAEIVRVGSQYKREGRYQTVREMMAELEGALRLLAPDPLDTPPLVPLDLPSLDELTPPSVSATAGPGMGAPMLPVPVADDPPSEPSYYSEAPSVYDEPPLQPPERYVIGVDGSSDEDTGDPRSLESSTPPPSELEHYEPVEVPDLRRTPDGPVRGDRREVEWIRIIALSLGTVAGLGVLIIVVMGTLRASTIQRHEAALAREFNDMMTYAGNHVRKDLLQTCSSPESPLDGCDKLIEIDRQLRTRGRNRYARQGDIDRMIGIVRERTHPDCLQRIPGPGPCKDMLRCVDDLQDYLSKVEDLDSFIETQKRTSGAQVAGCMGLVQL